MRRPSLNHTYRLVWNHRTNAFVAVAETTAARGKASRAGRALLITLGLVAAGGAAATNLPSGGQIVAGAGNISQNGNTLTITQNSAKLATDWQSFSIGQGSRVNFVQPSSTAVALNRVLGADPSVIQGALSANGQVFLINPNGVLFTPTAQVNVGGLVASTLNLGNKDFLDGNYRFEGASSNAVINQGNITAANGGSIALIAARVINDGTLDARAGNVLLGAGNGVTLDLGGPVKLQITQGAIDALVENGGAIRANGGLVYLTAKAANALTSAVINHSGVIEAHTLATGEKGQILLIGDMQHGTLNAGGSLDASAPAGGDGGFIETSAAHVNNQPGLSVRAGATHGTGGTWLIDPYDYTINATAAGTIATALSGGTSVTVSTQGNDASYGTTGAGSGDITVASAITKTGGGTATLTLRADRNIAVNSNITSSVGALNINLSAANNAAGTSGGVNINANLDSNGGNILIGGAGGSLTTAQSYGTGYALNLDSSNPAVLVGTNRSILSHGGNITINGRSSATTASYDGSKGGIYVKSGATVDTGGGNLYMSGISAADEKVFGFGVEASSGTVTTFKTSQTTGSIWLDSRNTQNALGALGLVNNGNQARVQFIAPSVAHLLFLINGSSQLTTFTISPPCQAAYPNCGTLVVPGGNQSYTYAGYQVVNMATVPLYIFTSGGTKEYDGNNTATGITLSSLGGPGGFVTSDLGALSFTTASKNVGSYPSVSPVSAPANYTSGGVTYAVGYFSNGSYSITPKPLTAVISNKVYDGTNSASVSASGIVNGDNLIFSYTTGTFDQANVGTWNVTASGIALSGTDAGNYSLQGGTSLSGTASITPRPLTLSGSRVYDGTSDVSSSIFTLNNVVVGEDLVLSGIGSVANKNVANGKPVTLTGLNLGNGTTGVASNYSLASGTADITKAPLTVSGYTASNKVYDANTDATLSGTPALAGALPGDTVSVSGSATGSFGTKNVGTNKAVNANLASLVLGDTDAGNYEITGLTAPLFANITKAPLTVSGYTASSKVYDANTDATLSGTPALAGALPGDTVSVSGSATGSFGTKNVGTNKAVNANLASLVLGDTDAGNYEITGLTAPLFANITPAYLTLTSATASRRYGAENPAFTGSVTGFVGGETLASATTGSLGFSSAATAGSGVGSHPIVGGGLTAVDGNYIFVQSAGNASALTITPALLRVTANDASKDANGAPYRGGNGVVFAGFVNGEAADVLTGTLSYGGSSQGASRPGTYAISPQGLSAGNYEITFGDGTLTINNSLPSDPQQYLPKPVQVQQFLTNTAALPSGTPPISTPDSLNYVAIASPTGGGAALAAGNPPSATPNSLNYVAVSSNSGGQAAGGAGAPGAGAGDAPRESGGGSPAARGGADDINVNNFASGTFKPTDIFVVNGGLNTSGLDSLQ